MIYTLLLPIIKMAIRFYFRRIDVIGKENLPKKGAVVLIVNHPSALLDPLVVAIIAGRQLHFLAAAEFFGGKLISRLFQNQFNMIPVYRPEVHKTTGDETETMFAHCYEKLSEGKAIIIFPEGTSETEKRLRKLKTGVVRMVLGAQKVVKEPIPIIPVGLNYTNPHRFQSDVLVSIGESNYLSPNNEIDSKEHVQLLTQELENSLKEQVVHIKDEHLETSIERVEQLFAKQLQQDLNVGEEELERKFRITKDVIKAVEYYNSLSDEHTKHIYEQLNNYYALIKNMPIKGRIFNQLDSKIKFLEYLLLAVLLPVFLIGISINALPYYFSSYIFKHKFLSRIKSENEHHQIKPVFGGSIAFGIGTISFIIWYLMLVLVIVVVFPWWWSLLFVIVAYVSGRLSVHFLIILRRLMDKINLSKVFDNNSSEAKEIVALRNNIIEELKVLAANFMDLNKKEKSG